MRPATHLVWWYLTWPGGGATCGGGVEGVGGGGMEPPRGGGLRMGVVSEKG